MKYKLITVISILIFSTLLWIFVSFSDEYSTTIKVPVRITNIPEGYSTIELSDNSVSLNVKGQGWQLAQLTFGIQEYLDIPFTKTTAATNDHIVSVRNALEQNSWVTSSIQVNLIEPEQLSYSIERINYKVVPIVPKVSLSYKTGYDLVSEIIIDPDTVQISGPKSVIDETKLIETEHLVLEALDRAKQIDIALAKNDNLNYSFERTQLSFDVQKIVDKTFENIEVERRGVPPARDLLLFPEKVKVILRGGINILGQMDNSKIKLYINFRQALEDTLGSIVPKIEIPEFTTLIDIRPKRLDYIIKQF